MSLSASDKNKLISGLADKGLGEKVYNHLDEVYKTVTVIKATSTSQTVDFAALKVGDFVTMVPAVAGNSVSLTVATAGTLGIAAVVNNLYVVYRKNS